MHYIDINQDEVVINFENNSFSPSYITITNAFYQRVAYKIKATNPDLFTVKPNRGFIDPQGNVKIEIQGHIDQNQDLNTFSSQKFLIIAKDANQARSLAEIDDLWKSSQPSDPSVQQRKLSTVIMRVQNGTKSQLFNPKLISSINVPPNQNKSDNHKSLNGDAAKQFESLVDKSYQIEEQMIQARLKRETLYNEITQQKKKSSSFIAPLILGIVVGYLQMNWSYLSN